MVSRPLLLKERCVSWSESNKTFFLHTCSDLVCPDEFEKVFGIWFSKRCFLHLFSLSKLNLCCSALWRKPLRNLELRILPKWGPWLPFSQARVISDENVAAKVTKHVARSNSLKGAHGSPNKQQQLKNCYLEKQTKNPKARIRVVMLLIPSVFCSMTVVFVLYLFSNKRIHLTL